MSGQGRIIFQKAQSHISLWYWLQLSSSDKLKRRSSLTFDHQDVCIHVVHALASFPGSCRHESLGTRLVHGVLYNVLRTSWYWCSIYNETAMLGRLFHQLKSNFNQTFHLLFL